MLIIIDESGDPSFSAKASAYFAIGGLMFDDTRQAELVAKTASKIKFTSGFNRELKSNSCPLKLKELILKETINKVPVRFISIIDKQKIKDIDLRKNS